MNEKTEYKGLTITIEPDMDAQSPDDNGDSRLFLVGWHRDFTVEREGYTRDMVAALLNDCKAPHDSIHNSEDYDYCRAKEIKKQYHIFPLEAYIHGGVLLYMSGGATIDRQWDVSQLGAVFVSREEWKDAAKARKAALSLLEEWNNYLSGNVWGYTITDQDGECLGSCWGYNGDPSYCLAEAKSEADSITAQLKKEKPMYKADAKKILDAMPTVHMTEKQVRALLIAIKNL